MVAKSATAKTPRKTPTRTTAARTAAARASRASLIAKAETETASVREALLERADKAKRTVQNHPRLVTGLVLGAGLVIGALVIRRFAPEQAKRLGAAAAGLAIAAGGQQALEALKKAPGRIADSKLTRQAIRELKKTPSRIADLHLDDRARDVSKIMVKRAKRVRHALTH